MLIPLKANFSLIANGLIHKIQALNSKFNLKINLVMSKEIILKEKYTEIYMNKEDGILYAKWNGFLSAEQVMTGCKAMTNYIRRNKIKTHLSDHRELKILSKEVQEYLTQQWFPEVEKEGLKKVAALVSEDVFAKATVDKVNQLVELGGLSINTFNSPQDCIKWLHEN